MTLSLVPDHGEVAAAYDRALRERNRLIRDGVRDAGWFEALEARMAEAGARLGAQPRGARPARGSRAAEAAGAFPGARRWRSRARGRATRPASATALARRARPRDCAAGRTLTGPHRDDLGAVYAAKGVPARLCSTGEQKALLVSLVLANARAVGGGLRAPRRSCSSTRSPRISTTAAAPRCSRRSPALGAQAFMTGTGPELFEGDRRRPALLVEDGDGGGSPA